MTTTTDPWQGKKLSGGVNAARKVQRFGGAKRR
jgi:hypothetical protein